MSSSHLAALVAAARLLLSLAARSALPELRSTLARIARHLATPNNCVSDGRHQRHPGHLAQRVRPGAAREAAVDQEAEGDEPRGVRAARGGLAEQRRAARADGRAGGGVQGQANAHHRVGVAALQPLGARRREDGEGPQARALAEEQRQVDGLRVRAVQQEGEGALVRRRRVHEAPRAPGVGEGGVGPPLRALPPLRPALARDPRPLPQGLDAAHDGAAQGAVLRHVPQAPRRARRRRRRRGARRPRRAPAGQVQVRRARRTRAEGRVRAAVRAHRAGGRRRGASAAPAPRACPRPIARPPAAPARPPARPARPPAPALPLARPPPTSPLTAPLPLRAGAPPRGGEGARGEAEGAEEGAEGRRQGVHAGESQGRAFGAGLRRRRGGAARAAVPLGRPARPRAQAPEGGGVAPEQGRLGEAPRLRQAVRRLRGQPRPVQAAEPADGDGAGDRAVQHVPRPRRPPHRARGEDQEARVRALDDRDALPVPGGRAAARPARRRRPEARRGRRPPTAPPGKRRH